MNQLLIAEDDALLAKVYESKMVKAGFAIRIATDGEEILTILKDFIPDVILLDLIMPKKDGFEVLQEIKNNPAWKTIPVIVTSNLSSPQDEQKARALGARDFVIKSDTSIQGLIDKIHSVIESQHLSV